MDRSIMFVFAVFTAAFFLPAPAAAMSAQRLDRVCNSATSEEGYAVNLAICLAYVHGVVDHEKLRSKDAAANGIFCIREYVSNEELFGITRRYLATRPARGSELASILVSEALEAAFPCRNAG